MMPLVRALRDLYWSSPRTTFLVLPTTVFVVESVRRRRVALPDGRYLPLLAWGYLQYRLVGTYRAGIGGGSRGMQGFPDRLVTGGPYGWCRNPMYLGHLIFAAGLALAFRSPIALALAVSRAIYFSLRIRRDEERLRRRFGDEYAAYTRRVSRWIPRLL